MLFLGEGVYPNVGPQPLCWEQYFVGTHTCLITDTALQIIYDAVHSGTVQTPPR